MQARLSHLLLAAVRPSRKPSGCRHHAANGARTDPRSHSNSSLRHLKHQRPRRTRLSKLQLCTAQNRQAWRPTAMRCNTQAAQRVSETTERLRSQPCPHCSHPPLNSLNKKHENLLTPFQTSNLLKITQSLQSPHQSLPPCPRPAR